jgi:hypothetical protein
MVDLSGQGDATFDAVYTGGHVAAWVSDLRRSYGEAERILKSDGQACEVWEGAPMTGLQGLLLLVGRPNAHRAEERAAAIGSAAHHPATQGGGRGRIS